MPSGQSGVYTSVARDLTALFLLRPQNTATLPGRKIPAFPQGLDPEQPVTPLGSDIQITRSGHPPQHREPSSEMELRLAAIRRERQRMAKPGSGPHQSKSMN